MQTRDKQDDKVRILSLDGGTHGFTWLFCLREIEEDNPGFLSRTDVFTGSSFGGFSSLYFARHMGNLKEGESALDLIQGCYEFMRKLLKFTPDEAAFARFKAGTESMYSHERMEEVLTDPKHLGTACLGDLHRRVVISTFGTKKPSWAPKVYDSAREEDKSARASEVGLESAALPLILPLRNGLCNGSVGGTNGSLHGVTMVVGGEPRVPLEKIVLLSLGGDPKTSNLADFPSPWEAAAGVPQKVSLDAALGPSEDKLQALGRLNKKVDELWTQLEATVPKSEEAEGQAVKPPLGIRLDHSPPAPATVDPGQRSTSWGWRQWLACQPSPLFLYQVITNNQAADTAEQCHLLLGERSFRIAPMALLSYGQILYMTFFSGGQDTIVNVANLTAELWADPETSKSLGFRPTIDEAEEFIYAQWMPEGTRRPTEAERKSGWRRERNM